MNKKQLARARGAATQLGIKTAEYLTARAENLAWCSMCRVFLPQSRFHKNKQGATKNGYCKRCESRYKAIRKRKTRPLI